MGLERWGKGVEAMNGMQAARRWKFLGRLAVVSGVMMLGGLGETTTGQAAQAPQSMWMLVTAYCPCKICCGARARGITASGRRVTYDGGRFAAADTTLLPFGSIVRIPGYHDGRAVEVIDRGGAIRGRRLDVFFKNHRQAKQWGRQWVMVEIGRSP